MFKPTKRFGHFMIKIFIFSSYFCIYFLHIKLLIFSFVYLFCFFFAASSSSSSFLLFLYCSTKICLAHIVRSAIIDSPDQCICMTEWIVKIILSDSLLKRERLQWIHFQYVLDFTTAIIVLPSAQCLLNDLIIHSRT